jgi:hypothetical protein
MSLQLAGLVIACLVSQAVLAADDDPCTRFTWDVSHELAVARQTPQAITAAPKPGNSVPQLQLDKLYELKLGAQSGVTFALMPGKPTLPDGSQGGLVRFHTDKAGRYRVSSTSGHWIDIIDHGKLIKSRDFQGARGCERPRKIVEYELPGGKDLTLQLSGSPDASVVLSITPVAGAPTG